MGNTNQAAHNNNNNNSSNNSNNHGAHNEGRRPLGSLRDDSSRRSRSSSGRNSSSGGRNVKARMEREGKRAARAWMQQQMEKVAGMDTEGGTRRTMVLLLGPGESGKSTVFRQITFLMDSDLGMTRHRTAAGHTDQHQHQQHGGDDADGDENDDDSGTCAIDDHVRIGGAVVHQGQEEEEEAGRPAAGKNTNLPALLTRSESTYLHRAGEDREDEDGMEMVLSDGNGDDLEREKSKQKKMMMKMKRKVVMKMKSIVKRKNHRQRLSRLRSHLALDHGTASSSAADATHTTARRASAYGRSSTALGPGDTSKSIAQNYNHNRECRNGRMTIEERSVFRDIIFARVMQALRVLIEGREQYFPEYQWKYPERIALVKDQTNACMLSMHSTMNQELADEVQYLWDNEPSLKVMYQYRHLVQFAFESAAEFFECFGELFNHGLFVPTERMVLQSYVKTTGIVEADRIFLGQPFRFVDVGGQRNERKKWVHVLNSADAVIYPVSLSEYNTVCYEDDNTNRTHESLSLFKEVVNSESFQHKPFYLMFTKDDVFLDKIQYFDLTMAFKSKDLPRDMLLERPLINHSIKRQSYKSLCLKNRTRRVSKRPNRLMSMDNLKSHSSPRSPQPVFTKSKSYDFDYTILDEEIEKDNVEGQWQSYQQSSTGSSASYPITRIEAPMTIETTATKSIEQLSGRELNEMLEAYRSRASELWRHNTQRHNMDQFELKCLERDISRSRAASRVEKVSLAENSASNDSEMDEGVEMEEPTLAGIPIEVLQHICLYLEPRDICRVQMVNYELYLVAGSDYLWRFVCLSYLERQEDVKINEPYVDELYHEHLRKLSQRQKDRSFSALPAREPSREMTMQKWKFLYCRGGYLAQRSQDYIINKFLSQIEDEDRRARISKHVYVTSPIDQTRFKKVFREICADLISHGNDGRVSP